jgi:dTDP-4-amino-4,6-dideoxygalactose transaminase
MILMNDFKAEPPELRQAMLDAVSGVLESGWYVLGPEVERFEKGWADACGTTQCVGVGNGMDAIEIALRALEIGAGDEVITTPMTAFATVLAIIRAGAIPVLADIEEGTGLLAIDSAERCLSSRTKAVVLVHLYGQVRAMDCWSAFCKYHRLALVEDCAQSHLATWKGKVAGSFGAAGAYSFYPTKNLGAAGDAGAMVTNDQSIASCARRLRNYGQSVRYYHPELGLNSRLDEIHAAMLLKRLEWLSTFTQRRQAVAERYRQQIDNPAIRLLLEPEEMSAHVYHLYVLCCESRDALQDHLKRHQTQTLIHYPVPVHLQQATKGLQRDPTGLKVSESHAQTCLSIPCHPQLSDAAVDQVIDAVNSFKRV